MGTLVKPAGRVREPDPAAATQERNPGDGSGGKAERPDGLWLNGDPRYRTRVMSAEEIAPQVLYPRALA
jgi:hypothetical protein